MSVRFKPRKKSVKQELDHYRLANEIHEFHDNLEGDKEMRKVQKIQRKFSKGNQWRSYVV